MKKQVKRIVAIVAALAMVVTSLVFSPAAKVSADDWTQAFNNGDNPQPWPEIDAGMWHAKAGGWITASYQGASSTQVAGFKWKIDNNGEAIYAYTTDLTNIDCVSPNSNGTGTYTKPVAGRKYEVHASFTYSSTLSDYSDMTFSVAAKAPEGDDSQDLHKQSYAFNDSNTTGEFDDGEGNAPVITMPSNGLYFKQNIRDNGTTRGWSARLAKTCQIDMTSFYLVEKTVEPGSATIIAPEGDDSQNYNWVTNQVEGLWTCSICSGYQHNETPPDYFWDVTATLAHDDQIDGFSTSLDKYSFPGSYYKGDLSGCEDTDGNPLVAGTQYNMTVTLTENTTDPGGQYAQINVRTSDGTENMAGSTQTGASGEETLTWTGVVNPAADANTGNPVLNLSIGYGNDGEGNGTGGFSGGFTVDSVEFEAINDPFTAVPRNTEDYHPAGNASNPWALTVAHNEPTSWGDMSYLVNGTVSVVDNTSIRLDNVAHDDASTGVDQDDPSDWWWYNGGKLNNYYSTTGMVTNKGYTGTFDFNYTAPDPSTGYTPKIRVIFNGDVQTVTLSEGANQITLPEATYTGTLPTIEFNFDLLEKGSIVSVSNVAFALTSDWSWQDDTQVSLTTIQDDSLGGSGSDTMNWTLYSAMQPSGSTINGCKLFYKTTETGSEQSLRRDVQVKVGEGNRWDPVCAQFNVTNASAYAGLTANTTYYMTYKFNSTAAGTVHITREGYEPNAPERFDVVAGENTFTRVMTYMPSQDNLNIKMSLTPTTYGEGGAIVADGTALPVDTILSDFEISFTRQDATGWTIVTDSREQGAGSQIYDDLVSQSGNPIFTAYSNSNYGGRLSYKGNQYPDGEDAIAKTGIRVDNLPGSTFTNTTWPASLRIPNSYFYNRTDTNDDALVDGDDYTLRFYVNVDLPDGVNSGTIYFKQEGYGDEHAYTVTDGLNMLNGTISGKSGYTSHDDYTNKSGGIEMTYDASKTTTQEEYNTQVVFDLSEMPNGAVLNDISWEFYAPAPPTRYDVSIDGTKVTDVEEGANYTLPSSTTVYGYLSDVDGKIYKPGSTYGPINEDVDFTSITKSGTAITVNPGAAMRLEKGNDKRGIAFQGAFEVNGETDLVSEDCFKTGMLITPQDFYLDDLNEELDLTKVAGNPAVVNIVNNQTGAEKWLTGKPGEYRAGITNVKDHNITRYFVARAYVTITYSDNSTETIYSDVTGDTSATQRSIALIAYIIKYDHPDYYATLSEEKRAIVDMCAEKYND